MREVGGNLEDKKNLQIFMGLRAVKEGDEDFEYKKGPNHQSIEI